MALKDGLACAMCGKQEREMIVGVKGGICPGCVGICNAVLTGSHDDPARFAVSEMGHCVLCDKGNSLKSTEYWYVRGANGDLCESCLEICADILNDVPAKRVRDKDR